MRGKNKNLYYVLSLIYTYIFNHQLLVISVEPFIELQITDYKEVYGAKLLVRIMKTDFVSL